MKEAWRGEDPEKKQSETEKETKQAPMERELPSVCPERMPSESPREREVTQGGAERAENPKRRSRRPREGYGTLYACVALSLVLTFALMIGALCLISAPSSMLDEEEVPEGEEALQETGKQVVWVHGQGEAEGAMSTPELYEAWRRSVVSIRTETGDQVGVGSGFVFDGAGHVATAAHVVAGCDKVEVILWDGSRFAAETVGCDLLTDLALLHIDAEGLVPVSMGKSDSLLAGERVVAIGTPASLEYAGSVCSGEVSCAKRSVRIYSEESGAMEKKMNLIQMSAPVNPGNSGCPLFDAFGRVVGVVTMRLGQSFSGIGFAIPSDGAAEILLAMREGEELTDALLSSVSLRAASLGIQGEAYEIGGWYGVRVTGFADPDAPASDVLLVGDMILRLGEESVTRASELEKALREYAPNDRVAVTVWRQGQTLTLDVILTARQTDEI